MMTWKRGRNQLAKHMAASAMPLETFFEKLKRDKPFRFKGTAVFLTLSRDIAPSVLLQHLKHNHSLHERVILLSIVTEHHPEVTARERVRVTDLELGFVKVVARYGYMEAPDIAEVMTLCMGAGLRLDFQELSFFLGRETFLTDQSPRLSKWWKQLFILLSRNARPATEFFRLPPNQVIEIGSQIQL
jgi:KUP system potassium uptake protein